MSKYFTDEKSFLFNSISANHYILRLQQTQFYLQNYLPLQWSEGFN
jgi:hypothetical protein